jgi:hypothetical protein
VSKDNLEKDYTWCTISVNEIKTTVLVRHLGRGKFKVIKDHLDGRLIGKIRRIRYLSLSHLNRSK